MNQRQARTSKPCTITFPFTISGKLSLFRSLIHRISYLELVLEVISKLPDRRHRVPTLKKIPCKFPGMNLLEQLYNITEMFLA